MKNCIGLFVRRLNNGGNKQTGLASNGEWREVTVCVRFFSFVELDGNANKCKYPPFSSLITKIMPAI